MTVTANGKTYVVTTEADIEALCARLAASKAAA